MAYGKGSVLVWEGICLGARTELGVIENGSLTALRYVSEILEPHVMPFAPFIGDKFVLMHNNDRPHTASVVRDYLNEVAIKQMDWPARFLDMNPVEHVWDLIGRRVSPKKSSSQEH